MTSLIPTNIVADYFVSDSQTSIDEQLNAVDRLPQQFDLNKRYFALVMYTFEKYRVSVTTYISNLTLGTGANGLGGINVASGFAIADLDDNILARAHIEPTPVLVSDKTTTQDILDITDQWAIEALTDLINKADRNDAELDAVVKDDEERQDYLNDSTEFSTQSDVE